MSSLFFFPQNSFYALYRSFTECVFIEEDGEIVFYKNGRGETARQVVDDYVRSAKESAWQPEVQDSLSDSEPEQN